jgi:hypothetical protein
VHHETMWLGKRKRWGKEEQMRGILKICVCRRMQDGKRFGILYSFGADISFKVNFS